MYLVRGILGELTANFGPFCSKKIQIPTRLSTLQEHPCARHHQKEMDHQPAQQASNRCRAILTTVSACGTATYQLAKFLTKILQKYTGITQHLSRTVSVLVSISGLAT